MRVASLLALTSLQTRRQILLTASKQQRGGGRKEVTDPQLTSGLISCDNGLLPFGFYSVFVYCEEEEAFIN